MSDDMTICTWPSCSHTAKGQCGRNRATSVQADPVAVRVKPLVWIDLYGDGTVFQTDVDHPFGYHAVIVSRGRLGWDYFGKRYQTIDAAKAAAKADYEASILSVLEPAPVDASQTTQAIADARAETWAAAIEADDCFGYRLVSSEYDSQILDLTPPADIASLLATRDARIRAEERAKVIAEAKKAQEKR